MSRNKDKSWGTLFAEYDEARREAKEAATVQEELKDEIKARLEAKKLEAVDEVEFVCTYKFEKDREVFDEELFAKKDPKKYKQWQELMEEMKAITKKYIKTQPGARKLIITRKNEGEE